jgi:hypothetical protein
VRWCFVVITPGAAEFFADARQLGFQVHHFFL